MSESNTQSEMRSPDSSHASAQPLLPRSAWDSQVTYLRTIFRVKKRLDRLEQASNNTKSEPVSVMDERDPNS